MAIVETYYINGIKCNIDDSAYRDKTPEELAVIRRNAENIARQIFRNPKVEICAFREGKWLRVAAKAVEDPRLEAQEHMLAAYPNLRDRYAPGDGNNLIFALTEVTATFSSFTEPSRTVTF